jgi:hypothetical protein
MAGGVRMSDNRIELTVALPAYHHTAEIAAGIVELAGVKPTFVTPPAEGADIADLTLLDYVTRRLSGDHAMTAVPVFPARAFVHSWIHVADTAVELVEPNPTASVYARGLLAEADPSVAALAPGRVLIAPPAALRDVPGVRPWLPAPGEAEREDYVRTGVYPILSVVAVRSELLTRERWLASNIYRAFEIARRRYFARLQDIRGSRAPIPSVAGHVLALRQVSGPDLWPNGLEPSRANLAAFVRHAAAQGLITRPPAGVSELFAFVEPFVDYTDGQ